MRGSEEGQFDWGEGVAIDEEKNHIVVVDRNNRYVNIFDQEGKPVLRFGETFNRPHGIAGNNDYFAFIYLFIYSLK